MELRHFWGVALGIMMIKHHNKKAIAGTELEQLWYVPDRRIRTKTAAEEAKRIAELIRIRGSELDDLDEQALFASLHTAAFRATRKGAEDERITRKERMIWAGRWNTVREYLVEKNLGLVYSMISRFASSNIDEDDLLSDAMFGLTRAVDRFDPWRGFRFSTYACNVIARALMRRGRQETNYRRLFPVQHDVSFERPAHSPDTQTELYVERLHRALSENLGELTDLESKILAQRFPVNRESRLTFKEIGDAIGLSKERVRQIQNIALSKLRDVLTDDPMLK